VADLGLPPGQAELVEAVAAQGKPVVLVVLAGRALAMAKPAALAGAVLYGWHPGTEGGAALGELLFGVESPSGHLPMSLPRATGQAPLYYNHKNSGRPVTGSLAVSGGFISRYVDLPNGPLYAFGHGLSYTRFEYSAATVRGAAQGGWEISAVVSNRGPRAGVAVPQLYVRDRVGSLTRPVRELKGFQRLALAAGESQPARFTLTEADLAFTRADGTRGVEPGQFQAWVSEDCMSGMSVEFNI